MLLPSVLLPSISFVFWLTFSTIHCVQLPPSSPSSAGHNHRPNLRALLWPIRRAAKGGHPAEGARINYKIYISPNKFQMNANGRLQMFVGKQRPVRAMLGSQGGMGEFDTPISGGTPDKLYIWVQEEESGETQLFVIKNPNFFKNYALDFRDGEVIEYEGVITVLGQLQLKTIFWEAKALLEDKIEAKYAKLRGKLFAEIDEILAEKFEHFLTKINVKTNGQMLAKLRQKIVTELRGQLGDELSILQKKKWIFRLVDG